VPRWNTYSPAWGPVSIEAKGKNHYLQLEDREPTDYARAIRVFPVSKAVDMSFKLAAAQVKRGRLEIELLGELGTRPVRLILDDKETINAVDSRVKPTRSFTPGLIGTFFNSSDLTDPENEKDTLKSMNNNWGRTKGNDWSARWKGFIESPYSGEVTFSADAVDGLRLIIDGKVVIEGISAYGERTGKVTMKKGQKTPVTLEFTSVQGKAKLVLSWSWAGQAATIVPASAVSYREEPRIEPVNLMAYKAGEWLDFNIKADCTTGKYTVKVNGREVLEDAGFAEPSSQLYAISLRTGEYRGYPDLGRQRDIPNTEEPAAAAVYRIDDLKIGR
jgi:hypothetical protein